MTLSKKKNKKSAEPKLKPWLMSEIEKDYEYLINSNLIDTNQKETFTTFKHCLEFYVGIEDYAKASLLRDAQSRYLKQLTVRNQKVNL